MYSKLQDGSFIVCGFVARDAELKTVGEKKSSLCRWSVKAGEKEKDWVNCQAWHKTARVAADIKKGDTVLCVGKIEKYTNDDGKEFKNLVCEYVSVMSRPAENKTSQATPVVDADDFDLSDFENLVGDDDPF